MPRRHMSPTAEVRASARRLTDLGLIDAFVPDDPTRPTAYVLTIGDESIEVPAPAAPHVLRALGVADYAWQEPHASAR